MSRWRPLEDYTPFARTLVEYMWEQRPPLLPAQLADRAGVSRQLLSRILNQDVQPDPLAVRSLARSMAMPTSQMFLLAGYTTEDDPLYAKEEIWEVVFAAIADTNGLAEAERTDLLTQLTLIRDGTYTQQTDDPEEELLASSEATDDADEDVAKEISA